MTDTRRIATGWGDEETMTTLTSLLDHLYEGDVVDTADLARVSDTNPRSVARWKAEAATPRRDAEERLPELRAVVDLARRVMRDDTARFWMRSPNPDLGYEKPLDVIAAGQYQRVVAELTRQAERQGLDVDALLPRELLEISADLDKVLDLTDTATLDALGIAPPDLVREDHRFTQEIGEAAHEHAFQAIRSPSATGVDLVLAIFPEKLAGAVLDGTLLGEWNTPDDLAHLAP